MQTVDELTAIIAKNITAYRKRAALTQTELAEKIGYSDKSVSKWEQGGGLPDVYVLMQIAEICGVKLEDIVSEHAEPVEEIKPKKKILDFTNKNLIISLSAGGAWLFAVVVFVALEMSNVPFSSKWLCFIYALPISAVTVLVFSCVWHFNKMLFFSTSALEWSVLLSVYLTLLEYNYWLIFIIGIPMQALTVLAFLLAKRIAKNKRQQSK